jgi:uncharacterized protein (UPF0210 family)
MASPLVESELEWWSLVDGLRAGDHVLFWRDASRSSQAVLEGFLRGARARDDLAAVFLPEAEWQRLAARLRADRISVDRLQAQGHLITISPATLVSDGERSADQIGVVLEELAATARRKGYGGLSILGSIAHPAFSRGDQGLAESIEAALHDHRRAARTLCLYDAADLYPLRIRDAFRLVRFHTHTLTASGSGHLFAEVVDASKVPRAVPRASTPAATADG